MLKAKLTSFKIGYGDDQVVFHPRMASIAEFDDVQLKLNDIKDSDEEKYQKQFDICIEAIAEWSSETPQKLVKEKGEFKRVDLVENPESSLDALKRYFAQRTPEGERIIREAYQLFLVGMRPESSFL
jgi:hypothetical protein